MAGTSSPHVRQVAPRYSVEQFKHGEKKTIQVVIALPGVANSGDIQCSIEDLMCRVEVPGLYEVDIPLPAPVHINAEILRFAKKKSALRIVLTVKDQQSGSCAQQASEKCTSPKSAREDLKDLQTSFEGLGSTLPACPRNVQAAQGPSLPSNQECDSGASTSLQSEPADMYADAKQQANRDAAVVCAQLALKAEQEGDIMKAVHLLQKASRLAPGVDYEPRLAQMKSRLQASTSCGSHEAELPHSKAAPQEGSSSSSDKCKREGSPAIAKSSQGRSGFARSRGAASLGAQPARQHQHRGSCNPDTSTPAANPVEGGARGYLQQLPLLGSSLSLLVGVALMSTAAYLMYSYGEGSKVGQHREVFSAHDVAARLDAVRVATSAAAAAAAVPAAAVGPAAPQAPVRSGAAIPLPPISPQPAPAASPPAGKAGASSEVWDWPGPLPPAAELDRLQGQASAASGGPLASLPNPGNQEGGSGGGGAAAPPGGESPVWVTMAQRWPGLVWLVGLPWRLLRCVLHALLWLPRTLFWNPNWRSVGSWWLFVAGIFLVVPAAGQLLHGDPSKVVGNEQLWLARCLILAWRPFPWLCCGGGWVAGLEEVLDWTVLRHWYSDNLPQALSVPVMCLLARWPLRWMAWHVLLPLGKLLVWLPRWYLHLPAAAAALVIALRMPESSAASDLSFNTFLYCMGIWLAGGGWWSALVAGFLSCSTSKLIAPGISRTPLGAMLGILSWGSVVVLLIRLMWSVYLFCPWLAVPAVLVAGGGVAWWRWKAARRGAGRGAFGSGFGFGFWSKRGKKTKHAGGAPCHLQHDVPPGAPPVVAQVLAAGNYYQVLGLGRDADDAEIRRAKRSMSLSTHPDKIGNLPGVNEAFNLVTEAAEALGAPDKRQAYEAHLTQLEFEARLGEDSAGGGIFQGMGQASSDASMDGLGLPKECDLCGGVHMLYPVPRPSSAARYCGECDAYHAVRPDEVWIERRPAGWFSQELKMYCLFGGIVWDITEVAICEGLMHSAHLSGAKFNTHYNPLARFRKGHAEGGGGGGRSRRQQKQQAKAASGTSERNSRKKGKRR